MSLAWRVEWSALSKRISGFLEAGQIYLNGLRNSANTSANHGSQELIAASQAIIEGLESFLKRHKKVLPQQASRMLERFLRRAWSSKLPDTLALYPVQERVLAFASIRPELAYYLEDFEFSGRLLSERAFSHLRRSIVADKATRCKWQSAYNDGETACEQLGAVHLLWHGIWAFKANSIGERTDLVMGDRLSDLAEAERSSEALVLTEWKRVTANLKAPAAAQRALAQAKRYASGSLSGIELRTQRYIVLVSEGELKEEEIPADHTDDDVNYRYVNIPVNPSPPSRVNPTSRN